MITDLRALLCLRRNQSPLLKVKKDGKPQILMGERQSSILSHSVPCSHMPHSPPILVRPHVLIWGSANCHHRLRSWDADSCGVSSLCHDH